MAPGVIKMPSFGRGEDCRAEYKDARRSRRGLEPRIEPYVSFVDVLRGGGMFGSSQRPTRSSMETEAAQVSEILRTSGIISYLSIHWCLLESNAVRYSGLQRACSTSKGFISTIMG